MKRKVLIATMMLLAVGTISVGCNKKTENVVETTNQESVEVDTDKETDKSEDEDKSEGVSKDDSKDEKMSKNAKKAKEQLDLFVKQLQDEDYTDIKQYFQLSDQTIVTDEDLEWAIGRESYSALIGSEEVEISVSTESNDTVFFDIVADDEDINISYKMNDNNEWKIDSDFLVTNFEVAIPGDTILYIGDVEVSTDFITGKTGSINTNDLYKIPEMIKKEKEFKVVSTNFGDFSETITPTQQKEPKDIRCDNIKQEDLDEMYSFIKDAWNEIYAAWGQGEDISSIKHLFVDDMDANTIQDVYSSLDKIESYNKNASMTNVQKREDVTSLLSSETIVGVNFNYTVSFEFSGMATEMKTDSSIRLEKVDGEYKIFEVPDLKLFSHLNQFAS